jgi:hypothetical protein
MILAVAAVVVGVGAAAGGGPDLQHVHPGRQLRHDDRVNAAGRDVTMLARCRSVRTNALGIGP